jgi:hypothetical protein
MDNDRPPNSSEKRKSLKSPSGHVTAGAPEAIPLVAAPKKGRDPLKKGILIVSAALVIFMGLVIYASTQNTKNYYLRSSAGAVEIWQGTFSPAGKKRLLIMAGARAPSRIKPVYSQADVYPLIFEYYIDKADALIHVPGMPDFVGIKTYLHLAIDHATTEKHRRKAQARIHLLDRKILFYKADVAASKGSIEGLQAAVAYLDQALELDPDEIDSELIQKKKEAILASMANVKPQEDR